ncbi:MAG: response regulator [bacterium]
MNNYLLVDDDQVFLFLHENMIKIADPSATIRTMQSSVKAVAYLEDLIQSGQKMPDCILVDLNMPEMNGFEFLDYCSQHVAGPMSLVHIYMVTSSLYESNREKALSFSFLKGFREKPLNREIVSVMLERMLKEKVQQQ